ncbi:rCG41077 [Rattus norvegicus]|uniref:RCG41077 n=1 Tax=Rattus norvegicus TaxID=10116 RepID=A6K269_RAT|nr:rCG41077 [Rattus norvegicus]
MIRLPEKPSSEALPFLCTTDGKYFKIESEPQSLWRSPALGCLVFNGALARLLRKLLLGMLGTHCLLEEHPIQELRSVPKLDSPHKGAQGRPREGNEEQKPRAWLTHTAQEPSVTACCLLANGQTDTGPHKRNTFQ